MDYRRVIVTTHSGMAVGLGSLRVSVAPDGGGLRVDLHFETPTMHCVLGVPPARLDTLAGTWNGGSYRYSLPPDDKVWIPAEGVEKFADIRPPQPIIETFPLPAAQPVRPTAAPLKKWSMPRMPKASSAQEAQNASGRDA